MPTRQRARFRQLRALWRDTALLFNEFRLPLLAFTAVVVGCGLLYRDLAAGTGLELGRVEAVYLVLSLAFLQGGGQFPQAWYLQLFFFAMPLLGLACLAQGLADFATLLFNRRARGKEWSMAVASTYGNHVILVGLGRLGYRVARHLHDLGQDVVVVERDPQDHHLDAIRHLDLPVIQGDGTREETLEAAGVRRARSILFCTQNDGLNLQMALKARHLHPTIDVVLRIFDDDFAKHLTRQAGFRAFSATAMAAPLFAAAAAQVDITPPVVVDGEAMSLARFAIASGSGLAGQSVERVERDYDLSVVLISRGQERDFHPAGDRLLRIGDQVAVLGAPAQLHRVVHGG